MNCWVEGHVAIDFPGFGLSTANDGYGFRPRDHAQVLSKFIDRLELDEIIMMVHDWSGPIGLWVASQRPPRFCGFVVGNTFVNLAMPLATTTHLPREVMRCYRRPFPTAKSREPIHIFAHELMGSHDFLVEVERNLGKLRDHPALLVWGERDVAFRASERARFEEIFPGHDLVLLDSANHFIQEDAPEIIAEGIDEWEDLACSKFR